MPPSSPTPAEFVRLPLRLQSELFRQCRARLPYEACGVWFGRRTGSGVEVAGFALVRNAHPAPERAFRFAPEDWVRLVYTAQKNRQEIVGFFHSHPDGTAAPSRSDRDNWTGAGVCGIFGLAAGAAEERLAVYEPDRHTGAWRPVPIWAD